MKEQFLFDRVLKELFQTDRTSLLESITGGVRIKEFLNVEFPKMMERRADLVALLEDGSIFHLEFQSQNDKEIAYREGMYCLLIGQMHKRPVRQVVLYVGQPKMRMSPELDAGTTKVSFRLIDIRDMDAGKLLQSGCPGDLALAMLAKGGGGRLTEIAVKIAKLSQRERVRALTQLALLSGLRGLTGRLKMELSTMGSLLSAIRKNEILSEVFDEVMTEKLAAATSEGLARGKAEGLTQGLAKGLTQGLTQGLTEGLTQGLTKGLTQGLAKGLAKGEVSGLAIALRSQLHAKFGKVPKWADDRMKKANRAQLARWLNKIITAQTLEGVIGRRP